MIEDKIKQGLSKVLVVFLGMIMVQTNWILGLNQGMSRLWNCLGFGLEKEGFFVWVKVKLPVKNKGFGGERGHLWCRYVSWFSNQENWRKGKKIIKKKDTSKSY